ncbi:MAG TPA: hypothetical protein VFW98_04125, partial [Gemmatimonadaceae bacterium]|nr:hypothetical protein [Gemmatimonadaceae bacterium]
MRDAPVLLAAWLHHVTDRGARWFIEWTVRAARRPLGETLEADGREPACAGDPRSDMNLLLHTLRAARRVLWQRFSRPATGRGRRASLFGGAPPGSGVLIDLRSAARMLRREKRFVVLVVLTLALGLGSTAAVFGMADQLLLRPLPGVHDDGRAAYLR